MSKEEPTRESSGEERIEAEPSPNPPFRFSFWNCVVLFAGALAVGFTCVSSNPELLPPVMALIESGWEAQAPTAATPSAPAVTSQKSYEPVPVQPPNQELPTESSIAEPEEEGQRSPAKQKVARLSEPVAPTGLWIVEYPVSLMDDSKGLVAGLMAETTTHSGRRPMLILQIKEGKIAAGFDLGNPVGTGLFPVTMRLDKGKARESMFGATSANSIGLEGRNAVLFLDDLKRTKRLAVRTSTFSEKNVEFVFNLAGVETVVEQAVALLLAHPQNQKGKPKSKSNKSTNNWDISAEDPKVMLIGALKAQNKINGLQPQLFVRSKNGVVSVLFTFGDLNASKRSYPSKVQFDEGDVTNAVFVASDKEPAFLWLDHGQVDQFLLKLKESKRLVLTTSTDSQENVRVSFRLAEASRVVDRLLEAKNLQIQDRNNDSRE